MHIPNLYFVCTKDHVLPFSKVGEEGMISHDPRWDWLSSQKGGILDRDDIPSSGAYYKDLVINVTIERA
jgi:hypothetical protein